MFHAWATNAYGILFALALGLCLGSFLNVVIHRLPRGESIVRPRSHCPRCARTISARDNVPVVSYLLLRGRCRHCRAPISPRYVAVEVAGGICVLTAVLVSAGPVEAAVRAAFLLAMLTVTVIDLDHRIIPDPISLPGAALGILLAPTVGVGRADALLGLVTGAGALFGVASLYRLARGEAGMGMGDVKLAGMMGAFLGWKGVVLALILGSFAGAALGIALMALRRANPKTALPYGTFLAPAAAVVILWGGRILDWYLGLFPPAGS